MIVLSNNDLEISIFPGRCVETKNYKKRSERSIEWSEVKKSSVLRHLTEKLMSQLTYELNGYSGMIFSYEQIEKENRLVTKMEQTETKPEINAKTLTPKLFLKSTEVEELYGISASTLANWRSKMVGPKYHKVGGSVRYKVEDLNEFMESKKIRTG